MRHEAEAGELNVQRRQMPTKLTIDLPRKGMGSLVFENGHLSEKPDSNPVRIVVTEGGGLTSIYVGAESGDPACRFATNEIPALVSVLQHIAIHRVKDMGLTHEVPPKALLNLARGDTK